MSVDIGGKDKCKFPSSKQPKLKGSFLAHRSQSSVLENRQTISIFDSVGHAVSLTATQEAACGESSLDNV